MDFQRYLYTAKRVKKQQWLSKKGEKKENNWELSLSAIQLGEQMKYTQYIEHLIKFCLAENIREFKFKGKSSIALEITKETALSASFVWGENVRSFSKYVKVLRKKTADLQICASEGLIEELEIVFPDEINCYNL